MKSTLELFTSIVFFLSSIFFLVGSMISLQKKEIQIVYINKDICDEEYVVNKYNIYHEIKEQGIKHPEIVTTQALLESGHFKSDVYKKYNNIFGFQNLEGYIQFKDVKSCIIYYKFWQNKYYREDRYVSYYDFLESFGYASDTSYISKLKRIKI